MPEFKSLDLLARRDPSLKFRSDEDLGVIRHLRGKLGEPDQDPKRAGIEFVREHRDLFGPVDPKSLVAIEAAAGDADSGADVIFEQRHGKYRVLGGSIRFHVNREGALDTVSNRLFPDLADVPKEPTTKAEQAVEVVRKDTRSEVGLQAEPEPMVVRHNGLPYLAWEVRLETDTARQGDWGEPVQWIAYVDATDGHLLYRYNNIQTAGPVAANGTGYYSGGGALNAWFDNTTYQLRDTTRTAAGGPEIRTNDEDGSSPSSDANANWNDGSTAPRDANQGAEVDAHRYAGRVVDYYRTVHGRNSFDGAGGMLNNLVHLGTNFSNGYWDGSKVNLGDGTGAAPGDDYECSDDWLAHEWTHAYTQFTCALAYSGESGALNEAFSDIMAAFITGDWLVFEDTWLNASAPAWRNMVDPTNGGNWNVADPINSTLAGHQPSHYSVRYTGTWDNGGVHVNSGIINNLFYLLTVGGTHTVSAITVAGIGQSAAERMLWRCMSVNLVGTPTATFLQFREAMTDACLDLFPTDLFKLSQVKAAFNAVGIGPDLYVRDNLLDTGAEPYPGGYLWASPDIINRTGLSANPTVEFADLTNDSLWQNVEFGQDNHIYIRLQNRGPATGDSTVNVYLSAATTFGTPGSWLHIGTLPVTGVASGAVRIAGPLTFPSAQIPSPGHYCMIAVLSNSLDPAPDTSLINSVSSYLDFVRGTNNIAYRNMDVVNDVLPGTAASFDVLVRALGEDLDGYAVRVDVGRFLPGAKVFVRGPAKVLLDAVPQGMALVARDGEDVIYEVLAGKERRKQLEFHGLDARAGRVQAGFDGVRIDGEFALRVEFESPDERAVKELDRPATRRRHEIVVRQDWKGEAVGGAGIRLEPPK
ncbi:MAG: M4 family metallopeptidase [Actinomycetota bacterium]|nr:M4 family metallopeptidase [Actinomycetota bacterium]